MALMTFQYSCLILPYYFHLGWWFDITHHSGDRTLLLTERSHTSQNNRYIMFHSCSITVTLNNHIYQHLRSLTYRGDHGYISAVQTHHKMTTYWICICTYQFLKHITVIIRSFKTGTLRPSHFSPWSSSFMQDS